MALALNNLKRVDMPLNKETKPNLAVARIMIWTTQKKELYDDAWTA